MHAFECECPAIDDWDTDPYQETEMKKNPSRPATQQKYRDKQMANGKVQFNLWVTAAEKAVILKLLAEMRCA